MSYTPRPPIPPYMNPSIPPPRVMPSLSSPAPRNFRTSATISSQPTVYHHPPDPMPQYHGPIITVFVGNISERVPETLIKRILSTCGAVINWKRVSTFGFCEYDGPTAGMRAVRLLSETEIDGKKLVAKVDAKNKLLLDIYKEEESKNANACISGKIDEKTEDEYALHKMQEILEEHKHDFDGFDNSSRSELYGNRAKKPRREDDLKIKALNDNNLEEEKRNLISSEIGKFRKRAEADEHRKELEKEKLLNKEKDKDREKDKERKRRDDKKNIKIIRDSEDEDLIELDERDVPVGTKQSSIRKDSKAVSDMSPVHKDRGVSSNDIKEIGTRRRRTKSNSRDREREKEREKEREHERERNEQRERDRERHMERDEKNIKPMRDSRREKGIEEELRERKKAEKKAREKEEAYQIRLVNWEQREKRKAKENEKYRFKETIKQEEREKDAKRLKEFVEDYDDERDDIQYYRGRELQRRLGDRVREADADIKDREKEREELEELKNKIFSGEYENPTQEYEKARKKLEQLYKPEIIINVNLENAQRLEREKISNLEKFRKNQQSSIYSGDDIANASRHLIAKPASVESISNDGENSFSDTVSNASDRGYQIITANLHNSRQNSVSGDFNIGSVDERATNLKQLNKEKLKIAPITMSVISLTLGNNLKKKKIEFTGVFNNDDENDSINNTKKRKLVPLDYDDNHVSSISSLLLNERQSSTAISGGSIPNTVTQKNVGSLSSSSTQGEGRIPTKKSIKHNKQLKNDATASVASNSSVSSAMHNLKKEEVCLKGHDEKRRHIKSIIDRIPTQKEELFNYKLDRSEIDNDLMERKIRPWINKKIIEYIGEPEPTLVDFICSKVLAGSPPQSILDDVQMVLDEEAEVFVVKMWRLLIYELDAKKVGLGK